jgi:hypothetical protein
VPEEQAEPVPVANGHDPALGLLGLLAERGPVDLAHAELHGGGVEVHAEGVGGEVVEVVGLEAGDVGGDLEAGVAEVLVEAWSRARPVHLKMRPVASAMRASASSGVRPPSRSQLVDECLGPVGEDLPLRERGLDARRVASSK